MTNVGKQIRAMRTMRKMKGIELARISGVPSCMISQIENEKVIPKVDTVEKLAKALDCEVRILPNSF